MAQSLLVELQPWTTLQAVSSTDVFTCPRDKWIDGAAFDTAFFRIEVRELTSCRLYLESAITDDDSAFTAMTGLTISAAGSDDYKVASSAADPLYRWVRWRVGAIAANATITFRIVALLKSSS